METSTKIIGGLSEFKQDSPTEISLIDRIKSASNEDEINYLLGVGKTYRKASVKTMKRWVKAASERLSKIKS